MIRRSSPFLPLAPAVASLLLALPPCAGFGAEESPAIVSPALAAARRSENGAAGQPLARPPTTAAKADSAHVPATDEVHGLLNLGESLTERGDYDAAEIAYRQVLNGRHTADSEIKTALLGLAHMHRKQGALTKAAAIYERFLKDYPGDDRTPDALLDLGRTYRSMGVFKLAIARFYNVINSTLKLPTSEGFARYQALAKTAQFEIAETHYQAGEFADAAKFFSRLSLLDLAPADRARAQFKTGCAHRLEGDLEGAVTTFRSFIEQWASDENVPEARYLLAVTLRDLKRPQEAFQATLDLLHAEKARSAADPRLWAYWQRRTGNQLANDFFETGDTLNAHAIYSGLVELSPDPAWRLPITYQIALCYERLGITDRARSSYQAVVDGAGKNPAGELAELAKMAAWRIEHLEWRDQIGRQITKIFDTTTGRKTALAAAPAAPKPGDGEPASPQLGAADTTPATTASTP